MDIAKYKALFITETQDHLQAMNECLIKIEENPADMESVNEAFRCAHSIKGMAASMGYLPVRDLAHALEDLMDNFRQGAAKPDSAAMDLLFKGLDVLEANLKEVSEDGEITESDLVEKIRAYQPGRDNGGKPAPDEPAAPPAAAAGDEEQESLEEQTASPDQMRMLQEFMPSFDVSRYKTLFVTESKEHLQSFEKNLDAIGITPADPGALSTAYRNAHSIKGMAATMGYNAIREIALAAEDLLEERMEETVAVSAQDLAVLRAAAVEIGNALQAVEEGRQYAGPVRDMVNRIKNLAGAKAQTPVTDERELELADIAPPEPQPEANSRALPDLEVDFDAPPPSPKKVEPGGTSVKAAEQKPEEQKKAPPPIRPTPPLPDLEVDFDGPLPGPRDPRTVTAKAHQGAGPDSRPVTPRPAPAVPSEAPAAPPLPETPPEPRPAAPSPAPPGKPTHTLEVIFDSKTAAPGVRAFIMFKRLEEVGRVIESRPPMDEVKKGEFLEDPAGLKVEVDLDATAGVPEIEKVLQSLTDVASFKVRAPESAAPPPAPIEESAAVVQEQGKIEPVYDPFAQPQGLPQTVRVKTSALDRFINALGEMIMVKSELREVAKRNPLPALESGLDRLDALIRDFHDQVMSIRMMPLESVVARLPRVVRDLAKEEGKKVKFEVKGRDIELDRAILEQLTDPFIHLLRNAVSHGIETPDERARLGKPQEGRIELEAFRRRDLVLIEVRDDGRGMDPFILKESAVRKGLIKSEEAAAVSDEDAYQFIFHPGFSTAGKVGMISGRGVGMDAVKSVVESVGGQVTLATQTGKGSAFTLHLPRTIAIVTVLLIKVADQVFGIPIAKILKTVEILPHQLRRSNNASFFLDRQELIPLKPLHRYLDLPEPPPRGRQPLSALIIESQKRKVALVVDELVGQEEAFIRPLGKPLMRISGLAGVTMLGDGRAVFVLDTMSLI